MKAADMTDAWRAAHGVGPRHAAPAPVQRISRCPACGALFPWCQCPPAPGQGAGR